MRPPGSTPALHLRDFLPQASGHCWGTASRSQTVALTYSGRAAIYQYLRWLQATIRPGSARRTVLLPAFHCPNVVDPVLHAGFSPRFFAIRKDLQVDREDFRRKLDDDTVAVLLIGYFGLRDLDSDLLDLAHASGTRVIADFSHSFLFANPVRLATDRGADAVTFSFWKLLPGGVGGGLIVCDRDRDEFAMQFESPGIGHVYKRYRSMLSQLSELTDLRERLLLRRRAHAQPPTEPAIGQGPVERRPAAESYPYDPRASSWQMPVFARRILSSADLAAVATARRRNYADLLERLNVSAEMRPAFDSLPSHAVPWGLPVFLNRRSERDYLMRRQGVGVFTFGETLHPLLHELHAGEEDMIANATFLSDNLLAFSIHQELDADYCHRVAPIINKVIQDH